MGYVGDRVGYYNREGMGVGVVFTYYQNHEITAEFIW